MLLKKTKPLKDKEGRVVLKRNYDNSVAHDTYYVYDVYGNLTYVLPPKAEGATTATVLDELCYQYQYDYRNRLVAKKLPGKQWEFMVYDKLDRVVATGPAFSPFSDVTGAGWLITKYDVFNRVVYTGWLNSVQVTSTERSTMQQAQNNATTINESKQSGTTIDAIAVNYSNNVAPTSFKLLSVNYYDDYAIPNVSGLATSVDNQTVTTATKGLATGSWMRVPTTTAEVKAETTSILYDYKYRPIRTYTANYLGGYTSTDSKLDAFSGQLQYNLQKHKRTGNDAELTVKEVFTYSPQKRLLTHTHQINGGTEQLLADNTYDELGKLTSKKVGNTSATPLQKVDYSYNIRGWLTQINEIKALQKGTDPKDLFGFKINYNSIDADTAVANPLYNGNIAETFWQFGDDGDLVYRGYGYKYDSLNRLKDASYQRPGFNNPVPKSYNENLTYDKNGNIMSLKRNGDADDQLNLFPIDDLSYTYLANSNKLMQVTDAQPTATSGFKDGITTGDDYAYDANGNITVDKNKNITAITYNHLNLPTKIIFSTGNIVYFYTASGQKMQKTVTEGTNTTTTDYLSGYQYQNTVLQFFPTAEGYVKNTPVSGTNSYSYVFNYTDHLGNVRLSYTKNPSTNSLTILEANSYYPFGLKHTLSNAVVQGQDYKYKFNGKELQDELQLNLYDFGARNYDPALGRWMNVDPLAEVSRRWNPYNYCYSNPLRFTDPDGMLSFDNMNPNQGEVEPDGMQAYSPIYNTSGKFLGTDNEGLQGKAIVMKAIDFTQGMKHEDAMKKDLAPNGGSEYYKAIPDYGDYSNFYKHYNSLPNRPDYDGVVEDWEARKHWNENSGSPLYIDVSKLNLSPLTTASDFDKTTGVLQNNFFLTLGSDSRTAKVHGTLTMRLRNSNTGEVGIFNLTSTPRFFDTYDFNGDGRPFRDFTTWGARQVVGEGTGFGFIQYGKNPKIPVKK